MNIEELIKERLNEILNELNTFRTMLEEEKTQEDKPFEIKIPYDLEDYYVIDECGDIYSTEEYLDGETYKLAYLSGATFKTKEQAKRYDKERRLLFKIHEWTKEKNEGWIPDWSNSNEIKYYIFYSNSDMHLKISSAFSLERFNKLQYFKTREIAQECIDLFGKEIKEVLVNE